MVSTAKVRSDSDAVTSLAAWSAKARVHTLVSVPNPTDDEADYRRRLGRVIVRLREASGMSQAKLAELVNRSEAALSRWETGKATPSAYDIRRIAVAVELPGEVADLLLYPPAVYDPVMERLFARIERFANERDATQPDPATQAELVDFGTESAIREGTRRQQERRGSPAPAGGSQPPTRRPRGTSAGPSRPEGR
jgi:transcriptional regulator with XRE-family HTH domain